VPEPESNEQEGGGARSFWSGTITFGLVSIPVALYAANRSGGVSLRMVSPEGTPLTRRYFSTADDRELEAGDIVRGYEVEKGQYVVVEDDELVKLAPEKTRDIDLRQFVKVDDIDPMYFERAYFLAPTGGSNKAYRLLAKIMEETGRAGIATFVMRDKEYLVAILAENGILRAETLRFADELRSPDSIGLPEPVEPKAAKVKEIESEIAKLKETRLNTSELKDRSSERLLKVVKAKLKSGEDVVHVEPSERDEEDEDNVVDLMQLLKRSMQGIEVEAEEKKPKRAAGGGGKRKTKDDDLEEASKADLLERAKKLDIAGRSGMSKQELVEAIRRSA